jgi:cadmium resistance protein CadD (predicted permease)
MTRSNRIRWIVIDSGGTRNLCAYLDVFAQFVNIRSVVVIIIFILLIIINVKVVIRSLLCQHSPAATVTRVGEQGELACICFNHGVPWEM